MTFTQHACATRRSVFFNACLCYEALWQLLLTERASQRLSIPAVLRSEPVPSLCSLKACVRPNTVPLEVCSVSGLFSGPYVGDEL